MTTYAVADRSPADGYLCPVLRPLLLCCLLPLLAACSPDQEDVNIRLTMAERERLDKMVAAEMDSIRPLLQAACAESFDERVLAATDSIVQRQLEDEARLRARIPENLRYGR